MTESVPSSEPGEQKRRSTRIVHAVPLTVSGVDALGQPFKERTSTLIISCHGCKYQSKHYVPKNSYITVEVPNPDPDAPPRITQARVTWVQRPRTVRELFQVGAELEVPGNIWGVAFPPEDWFPWPEAEQPEIPAPLVGPAEPESPVAAVPPGAPPEAPPSPAGEEKARVVPFPAASEISAVLARQMAKLLVDARQQLQTTAREAAQTAATEETRRLLGQVDAQLRAVVQQAVDAAAASSIEGAMERALAQIEEARQATAAASQQQWAREAEKERQNWNQFLTENLTATVETYAEKLSKQLAAQLAEGLERIKAERGPASPLAEAAEATTEQLRAELDSAVTSALDGWRRKLADEVEVARSNLSQLSDTAQNVKEEISAATRDARNVWRQQAEADMAATSQQWKDAIQSTVSSAASLAEQEMAGRVAAIRQSTEQLLKASRENLATLRAGLDQDVLRAQNTIGQIGETMKRAEAYAAQLQAATQTALEEATRRFEILLAAQSDELNRRAEAMVGGIAERLRPSMEEAGQQALVNFRGQLEQYWKPYFERAEQSAQRLNAGRQELEDSLGALRDRLNRASDQISNEALQRMQGRVDQVRKDFEQAGRAVLGQFQEELEAKSTELSHSTFEALFKASDWYQKKTQTSMQAVLEKAVDQSNAGLREKAAEISRLFASELDHYSRSYVDHTRALLDDVVKEAVKGSHTQLVQTSQTTAASFADEVHRIAQQAVRGFTETSQSAVNQAAVQLSTRVGQVRSEAEAHFQKSMEKGFVQARQTMEAQLAGLLQNWRARYEALQKEWLEHMARAGNESVEQYRSRLENASNSWMVASVTTLTQHSQKVIESIAKAAEARLRQTCSQVFAGVAENLRARLLGLSSDLQTGPPSSEKKK